MITRHDVDVFEGINWDAPPRVYRVASNVTLEDYLEFYAEQHCEYVEGEVFREMPIRDRHELIRDFLRLLFQMYFMLNPIGLIKGEPIVMFQPAFPKRRRQPDLMIVLNDGIAKVEETQVNGAADIVIEIVSPASFATDHGDKFQEYEKSGVGEYWLIDFMRREARFYRLDEDGVFRLIVPDVEGNYTTPRLPHLKLHVPTLWDDTLPNPVEVLNAVREMLGRRE